jgi:hypothetical protein
MKSFTSGLSGGVANSLNATKGGVPRGVGTSAFLRKSRRDMLTMSISVHGTELAKPALRPKGSYRIR